MKILLVSALAEVSTECTYWKPLSAVVKLLYYTISYGDARPGPGIEIIKSSMRKRRSTSVSRVISAMLKYLQAHFNSKNH